MRPSFQISRVWVVLFVLLVVACSPFPRAAENKQSVSVSGAFALYPMMTRWAEEYQRLHPEIVFDISAGGAGKGMADALAGVVDIGMVSRAITPEEEAKGAFWVAVAKDAVFPTMNVNNPVKDRILQKGLTRQIFYGIFISGEITTWGQAVGDAQVQDPIHVYTRSDAAGAPETWAKYLGKKQEDLLGVGVFGDPGLIEAVARDPLGIGFNNLGYAYDQSTGQPVAGIWIIPIDANENNLADPEEILDTKDKAIEAVATHRYPSPPARELYLVTLGKPSGVVLDFIQWILTDGQQFVEEAGYIQLPQKQIEENLQKLKD
ncbi:MAG: substrate-binding domain-containing protein [Anaerolineales bacterium]|nr:substrate-binding domain-containing protein [Anaerolineales bacterium]MCS7247308.1 substrate-binding domain-containing protein [Anaerolineales bacterium]MDW8161119.1 substrate-binding domain-containing protein [Anaerolineales bacterium]MDW8446052.1 substrate-binding domain-containing protein [Anaerolineales bacterium]